MQRLKARRLSPLIHYRQSRAVVCDKLGTDEDVKGWTNAGIIDEDAHVDMSEFGIAHDRKQP
jgi:hypothetical protein